MKVKHKQSSSLNGWGITLLVFGILSIIAAVVAFLMDDSKAGATLLNFGFLSIVVGVLFYGLAPVSAAAETKLAESGDSDYIIE